MSHPSTGFVVGAAAEREPHSDHSSDPAAELPAGLSARQQRALEAIWVGESISRVAIAAGVSRNTIYRWKNESAPFREACEQMRRQSIESTRYRAELLTDTAMDTIAKAIVGGNYRAAFALLGRLGTLGDQATNAKNASQLTERLSERATGSAVASTPDVSDVDPPPAAAAACEQSRSDQPDAADHRVTRVEATSPPPQPARPAAAPVVKAGGPSRIDPAPSRAEGPSQGERDLTALTREPLPDRGVPREPVPTKAQRQLAALKAKRPGERSRHHTRHVKHLQRQIAKEARRARKQAASRRLGPAGEPPADR